MGIKFKQILILGYAFLLFFFGFYPLVGAAQSSHPELADAQEKARNAGIPVEMTERIIESGKIHGVTVPDQIAFFQILISANTNELPIEPLVSKIQEGLSKNVSSEKILTVLRQQIDDFRYVQSLFPNEFFNNDLNQSLAAIADSLKSGFSRDDLSNFISNMPIASPQMMAIAVENLTLMQQMGFNQEIALTVLRTGLQRNSLDSSYRYLAKFILVARGRGLPDLKIANATIEALENHQNLRELMKTLGFTSRDMRYGPTNGRTK